MIKVYATIVVIFVGFCMSSCVSDPVASQIPPNVRLLDIDTIKPCARITGPAFRNIVINDSILLDSLVAWQRVRNGGKCIDFSFPYIDFTRTTLVSLVVEHGDEFYRIDQYVFVDHEKKVYRCTNDLYSQDPSLPYSPVGSVRSLLIACPRFDPLYEVEFVIDTIPWKEI
ncbi:MAG: hypothetical protein HQ472_10790 [Ignavibacteria bacterium]|nr:hypothetical protein [Ignavibacteria bacterium]